MGTDTVVKVEFSKWIPALSSDDAIHKAKSFWSSEKVISDFHNVICFQNSLKPSNDFEKIEWFVHSKVQCSEDHKANIVKHALKNSWESEDGVVNP